MIFDPPLAPDTLVRRYKRFLADVVLENGDTVTMHCPNTGAMTGCAEPGSRVWYSTSANRNRKYPHTWELVEDAQGHLISIHSARTNALVCEAIAAGHVPRFKSPSTLRREVSIPGGGGRFDIQVAADGIDTLVEVKSVTLKVDDEGGGAFPDAVSDRATRHAHALAQAARDGHRAVLCFGVVHNGIDAVRPATEIDPRYAHALADAMDAGVAIEALRFHVAPDRIEFDRTLPFALTP